MSGRKWVGNVPGIEFDKPRGSLREERGIPEVEIKFHYSELLQSERSLCEMRYDSKQVIGMTKKSRISLAG